MSFYTDLNTENVVGKWMVDNFWKHFNGHRVDDIELQKSGVDVILDIEGRHYYVDEKIKNSDDINSEPFHYPSVEIMPNCSNTSKKGWWANPGEKTQLYAFINLSADNTDFKTLQYDEIEAAEVMLFGRKQLKEWQEQHVASDEQIWNDACQLARDKNNTRIQYFNFVNERTAHLKKSWHRGQQAINLVISRSIYKSLKGTKTYIVTTNGIEKK